MQNTRDNDLATKPIGKLLWQLSLPAIAAQVVNLLYNVVDRMYIGHIPGEGAMALTGLGVTMPLIVLVMAFASLASVGGAPRAAIMMGRGKKEEAERQIPILREQIDKRLMRVNEIRAIVLG